ncbi:SDR family oxidoreductase [Micromonospora sp. NPDC047465]|uniref:SDR family oxidoreductase n=1 Tax=Micromonospora sp. NPDC047465 TaxID=3154813 RepID=UPI0033DF13E7
MALPRPPLWSRLRAGESARTADVRDQAALDAVGAEATEKFGGIDILVSNAGIANQNPALAAENPTLDDVARVVGGLALLPVDAGLLAKC